jgi:hypothetical protein
MKKRLLVSVRSCAAGLVLALVVCGASAAFAATGTRKLVRPEFAASSSDVSRERPSDVAALADPIASDIPGTEIMLGQRTTTLTGSLSIDPATLKLDDVYAVYLLAGEVVDLSMSGSDNTDFGLMVFDESADTVYDDYLWGVPPYFYGGPDSYPAELSFKAPAAGYYYLDVYTWRDGANQGNDGTYSLDVTLSRAGTFVSLDPSSRVASVGYGGGVSISGFVGVMVTHDGLGEVPAGDVLLLTSYDGVTYLPAAAQTLQDGEFNFSGLFQFWKTYYMVQYEGESGFSPSGAHTVITNPARVMGAYGRRVGSRRYVLSGSMQPWHYGDAATVRIYLWKYSSGHWRAKGYRTATARGTTINMFFAAGYRFPSTGKWRMRAYHSDSDHTASWSNYTYLNVK